VRAPLKTPWLSIGGRPTHQEHRMTYRTFARSLALGGLLATVQFAAFAQAASAPAPAASMPRVDQRQQNQATRIEQGVASGELTRREVHRAQRQQAIIDNAEAKAKADGTVTNKEKAKLHAMQEGASKSVARQKHDRMHAASAPAARPASAAASK
jgi:hypothetical protein